MNGFPSNNVNFSQRMTFYGCPHPVSIHHSAQDAPAETDIESLQDQDSLIHLNVQESLECRPQSSAAETEQASIIKRNVAPLPTETLSIGERRIPEAFEAYLKTHPKTKLTLNRLGEGKIQPLQRGYIQRQEHRIQRYRSANDWANEAISFIEIGRYKEAIEVYKKILELGIEKLLVWYSIGVYLLKLERHDEASAAFDECLKRDPDYEHAMRGKELLNNTVTSVEQITNHKTLPLDSSIRELWEERGFLLNEANKFDNTKEALEESLPFNSQSAAALYAKGEAQFKQRRYLEAFSSFKQTIELGAQDAQTWSYLGRCLFNLDEFEAAKKTFDEALKLDPMNKDALHGNGLLKFAVAVLVKLKAIAASLVTDPENPQLWYDQGFLQFKIEQYDGALESFEKSTYFDSGFAPAWYSKGETLFLLNRKSEAIEAINRCLKLDPSSAKAWDLKGGTLIAQQQFKEAIKVLKKALFYDPKNADAWTNLGIALSRTELRYEALEAYNKAIICKPDHILALSNKGYTLIELDQAEEALKCIDKAIQIDEYCSFPWNNRAQALYMLKKYPEANEACDRSLQLDENDAHTWNNKGFALFELEQYEEAAKAFDHALQIDPSFVPAKNKRDETLIKLKQKMMLTCK